MPYSNRTYQMGTSIKKLLKGAMVAPTRFFKQIYYVAIIWRKKNVLILLDGHTILFSTFYLTSFYQAYFYHDRHS